jgi:cell division septum initiation protein DivIVA
MIDTDKYEGHDNWEGTKVNMANEANKLLIADAPLLLEEVKRLREENDTLAEAVKGDNEILKKYIEALAEVERLREGIQQALDAMSSYTNHRIYNSSWNILKELI